MIEINKLNDNKLIVRVQKNNCEESLKELISRHGPICLSVFKKYLPKITSIGIDAQDLYNEKDMIIWKAALNFNPKKNSKFSTWACNQSRYVCLNLINNRPKFTCQLDAIDNFVDNTPSTDAKSKNMLSYINNVLGQIKDKRIKKIYKMRYFGDGDKMTPWYKIGAKIGCSAQTVINLHQKHLHLLKSKLESSTRSDFI